jgi:CDGSH-type Zn-finger protein
VFAKWRSYVRAGWFDRIHRRASSRKQEVSIMPDVSIRTRENGPLLVTGPITLVDADGNQFNIAGKETIALCRCGQSKNRPFCDGQHKACGFVAGERAVPPPEAAPAS